MVETNKRVKPTRSIGMGGGAGVKSSAHGSAPNIPGIDNISALNRHVYFLPEVEG